MRQSSYFSIEDVPLNLPPLLFPLPIASKIDFVSSDNDARPLVYRPDGRQLYIARCGGGGGGGGACVSWNRCAHLSLPVCVHTPKQAKGGRMCD